MNDKKFEISILEAKNILNAIDFIFSEGFTGDGLDEIKEKLEKWLEQSKG